jgi:hypothetical protein
MRSFMLLVGFSLSNFRRMREPFLGRMLRKATKEVLPMRSTIFGGNSFTSLALFLTQPDGMGHEPFPSQRQLLQKRSQEDGGDPPTSEFAERKALQQRKGDRASPKLGFRPLGPNPQLASARFSTKRRPRGSRQSCNSSFPWLQGHRRVNAVPSEPGSKATGNVSQQTHRYPYEASKILAIAVTCLPHSWVSRLSRSRPRSVKT